MNINLSQEEREELSHELALDYELQRRKRMDADCGYYAEEEVSIYQLPPEWEDPQKNHLNADGKEMDIHPFGVFIENKPTEKFISNSVEITIEKVRNGYIICTDYSESWIASSEYAVGDIVREIAGKL